MYKFKDIDIVPVDGSAYLMTGIIEHPKGVNIKLEKIENNEEEKLIVIAYQAILDSKNPSEFYEIHQTFERPEWAEKVLVTLKNTDGIYEDPYAYIFD